MCGNSSGQETPSNYCSWKQSSKPQEGIAFSLPGERICAKHDFLTRLCYFIILGGFAVWASPAELNKEWDVGLHDFILLSVWEALCDGSASKRVLKHSLYKPLKPQVQHTRWEFLTEQFQTADKSPLLDSMESFLCPVPRGVTVTAVMSCNLHHLSFSTEQESVPEKQKSSFSTVVFVLIVNKMFAELTYYWGVSVCKTNNKTSE